MKENRSFSITLKHLENYQFETRFDDTAVKPITVDEPPPLGRYAGPSASRLLAASVGHCLSASLLFCFQKARIDVENMETHVKGTFRRNEKQRLRVGQLDVTLKVRLGEGGSRRVNRCLEIFEDYCVVTASVRKGVNVTVTVTDSHGNPLKPGDRRPETGNQEQG